MKYLHMFRNPFGRVRSSCSARRFRPENWTKQHELSQSNFFIVFNIVGLHIANMLFSCCTNFLPCDKSRPHSQIVQFWLADCRSTMWVYSPFRAYSSAGLPCSATIPPDSTTILSAPATVRIRWAMIRTVLCFMSRERAS